jgi:phosphate starvation-inducible membrane PsiE
MAFLMLVKDHERLPKLLNLFVYQDFTHIVIEYFKFKPFIVQVLLLRLFSILYHLSKLSTISMSFYLA